MRDYIGNSLQIRGAEQYVLQNGKGDGMHFIYVRNGLGLEVWISVDRCGDVSRVSFKGDNIAYFSPCGYVAPQYYDINGTGFLKSFTGGFFTTCGLTAVGAPCTDEGEALPLHGTISNTPATVSAIEESQNALIIKLKISDSVLFGRKLIMNRTYTFSYTENTFEVSDTVTNEADTASPYMIMYHCNIGYPLLNENSVVRIPNNGIRARDEEAEKYIDTCLCTEKPQPNFAERCYYYDVAENGGVAMAGIYSHDIDKGVILSWDKKNLPCFTEWKMMGKTDYVLGLEPGNCTPDGRDVMRKNGTLEFIEPEESNTTSLSFTFLEDADKFHNAF